MAKLCQEIVTCGQYKDTVIMLSSSRIMRVNCLQFVTNVMHNLEQHYKTTAWHAKTTGRPLTSRLLWVAP